MNRLMYGDMNNAFQLDFCWITLSIFRYGIIFFGIALLVSLYKRALSFEKEFMPLDPEKVQFDETLEEMSTHINEIFKHIKN